MKIDVFTLFPASIQGPLDCSILKRARERGLLAVEIHDIRSYATDRHRVTDDSPYGGGAGMVMKPEPIFAAVEAVMGEAAAAPIVLLTPQGRLLTQRIAEELSEHGRLGLICGHYEGVDERVREHLATDQISIGDYVLTGGEIPALVLIDCVARLLPGVLGDEGSAGSDSFSNGLLEHPHYTRPAEYRGWKVPEVLLSGHHAEIAEWRHKQSLLRTERQRPDLLKGRGLSTSHCLERGDRDESDRIGGAKASEREPA